MTELQSLFTEQPEASAETPDQAEQVEQVQETPAEGSENEAKGDDNTEINHTSETEDAETSSPGDDQGDETKPSLEQVKITLDDEDFELNLPPQIAEKVKNGVMMQHQFTKNSQALADQRRDFEAETAKVREEQQNMLSEMAAQLMFSQHQLDTPEMKQLKEFNRSEYDRIKGEYDERYQAYSQYMEDATKAHQEQRQTQIREQFEQETERLKTMIPEWLDETRRKEDQKVIKEYGQGLGFTPEQLKINNAGLMKVFLDASKYAQAQKNIQTKKSKPAATSVKASAKPEPVSEKPLWEHFYG